MNVITNAPTLFYSPDPVENAINYTGLVLLLIGTVVLGWANYRPAR